MRERRIRAVAAVTLVGVSLGFGVVLGVISSDRQPRPTAEQTIKRGEENSPQPLAERMTFPSAVNHATLALGDSDPRPASTSEPPVTLLNPSSGARTEDRQSAPTLRVLPTEGGPKQADSEERTARRKPDAEKVRTSRAPADQSEPVPQTAKDYRALREYMLAR
jgi:hypothetical protein